MSRTVWLAIAFAFVLGVLWFVVRGSRMDAPLIAPEVSSAQSTVEPTTRAALDATPIAPARTEIAPAPPVAEAPPPAAATSVTLHGTVVVVDVTGVEHFKESGTLTLVLWRGKRGDPAEATVTAGEWSLTTEPCEKVAADSGLLGGRSAFALSRSDTQPVPPDGRVDFRLSLPNEVVLQARDAVTNRDVSRLEVRPRFISDFEEIALLPTQNGKSDVVLRGDSPMRIRAEELAGNEIASTLFVRAPGYAWSHTKFDRRVGGEVRVELVPGCEFEVNLIGSDPSGKAVVRVKQKGSPSMIAEAAISKRTSIPFEGVPAGAYTVAAEIGQEFDKPTSLGQADFELTPDHKTTVELTLKSPPQLELAVMSGVLIVPSAWQCEHPKLDAFFLDTTLESQRATPTFQIGEAKQTPEFTTFEWRMQKSQTGRYLLTILDPLHTITAELLPGGTANVRIEVPPPADVSVRVVDATTNTDVVIGKISWQIKSTPRTRGMNSVSVTRNAVTGAFEFRCPTEDIMIDAMDAVRLGYAYSSISATIHTGHNSLVLSMSKACEFSIRVMDGEKLIEQTSLSAISVIPVTGDGRMNGGSHGGSKMALRVSKPGTYRVNLAKPIPGFLPCDDVTVTLEPGQTPEVVLRLTRKP